MPMSQISINRNLLRLAFAAIFTCSAGWPTADAVFLFYNIFISDGIEKVNRQRNFGANVVGVQTQEKVGPLTIPASALTAGATPNNFSYQLTFDNPVRI